MLAFHQKNRTMPYQGHTRILHFPEDEEIWSGGQASRSGHDFESGASLLTVTTT